MISASKITMLLAMCLLAMAPQTAQAVECETGLKGVYSSGAADGFKTCSAAAGAAKIPTDCCTKLAAFASYASCLNDPKYSAQADSYLAPVTLAKAKKDCLGR